jgi:hypothetical protein
MLETVNKQTVTKRTKPKKSMLKQGLGSSSSRLMVEIIIID